MESIALDLMLTAKTVNKPSLIVLLQWHAIACTCTIESQAKVYHCMTINCNAASATCTYWCLLRPNF